MPRAKAKPMSVKTPQTDDEADEWMRRLARINIWIRDTDTELREQSAALKQRFEDVAKPHRAEKADLEKGLFAWAEANRDRLTKGGRTKTVKLPSGKVAWRTLPPKVTVRGIPAILKHLKSNGLQQFIRTKSEIDKDAMLKEPELAGTVPGVSVGSAGETIDFVPDETTLDAA